MKLEHKIMLVSNLLKEISAEIGQIANALPAEQKPLTRNLYGQKEIIDRMDRNYNDRMSPFAENLIILVKHGKEIIDGTV